MAGAAEASSKRMAALKRLAAFLMLFGACAAAYLRVADHPRDPVRIHRHKRKADEPAAIRWETGQIHGVIAFLVPDFEEDLVALQKTMGQVEQHFNERHRYPYVIFHEGFSNATIERIRGFLNVPYIFFIYVDLVSLPEWFDHSLPLFPFKKRSPMGYMNMIRFFFRNIFYVPELKQVEYFLRLDTDSEILSTVPVDLFREMKEGGFVYGYKIEGVDPPEVTVGLADFTFQYMERVGNIPQENVDLLKQRLAAKAPPLFYNNFEMVNMPFFRRPDVAAWTEAVDRSQKIYTQRWGDAPLRWITLHMLTGEPETEGGMHHCKGWRYCHQGACDG
jgi:hypothetical protein